VGDLQNRRVRCILHQVDAAGCAFHSSVTSVPSQRLQVTRGGVYRVQPGDPTSPPRAARNAPHWPSMLVKLAYADGGHASLSNQKVEPGAAWAKRAWSTQSLLSIAVGFHRLISSPSNSSPLAV